jgi:hypothetical protein
MDQRKIHAKKKTQAKRKTQAAKNQNSQAMVLSMQSFVSG